MNNKIIFVKVSSTNNVYDTSYRGNRSIPLNTDYKATNGILRFTEIDGRIHVERFGESGKRSYIKALETGMTYSIAPLFVQAIPTATAVAKNMYGCLKKLGTAPKFKIIEDSSFKEPIKIQFIIKNVNSVLVTTFLIRINPDKVYEFDTNEQVELISRVSKLDLSILVKNLDMQKDQEVTITIDNHFVEQSLLMQQLYRKRGM